MTSAGATAWGSQAGEGRCCYRRSSNGNGTVRPAAMTASISGRKRGQRRHRSPLLRSTQVGPAAASRFTRIADRPLFRRAPSKHRQLRLQELRPVTVATVYWVVRLWYLSGNTPSPVGVAVVARSRGCRRGRCRAERRGGGTGVDTGTNTAAGLVLPCQGGEESD